MDRNVFIRLIIEYKKQALDDAKKDLRALMLELAKLAAAVGVLRTLGKTITAPLQVATLPVRALGGALKDLGSKVLSIINPVNWLTGAWENFWRTIRMVATRFILYRILDQMLNAVQGFVRYLLETTPAFEQVLQGFYNIAQAAGTTGDALLKAMQQAAAGTLTQLDLMQKATYAIEVYGTQIVQYLPELVAGARRASKVLGIDMTFAYNSLIDGIARTSKKLLDNIGIVFNANAAYEAHAATLGKAAAELTEAEEKTAYLNATLAFLRAQAKALGPDTLTAKDALAALRAEGVDLLTISMMAFLPVVKRVALGLRGLLQGVGPSFQTAMAMMAALWDQFVTIFNRFAQAIKATPAFQIIVKWLRDIGQTMGYFITQIDRNMPQILNYVTQLANKLSAAAIKFLHLSDAAATGLYVVQSIWKAVFSALEGDWDGFWRNLSDGAKTGLTYLLITVVQWGRNIFHQFDEWTGGFLTWGINLAFQFAKGLMSGAATFVTVALTFLGNLIASFIGASSPPAKGPLANIVKWGMNLIKQYFLGFTLASFDFFEQAIRPIEERIQAALSMEGLDADVMATRFAEAMTRARELLGQYTTDLQKYGTINEGVLASLGDLMGDAGDDVLEYLRVLGRLSLAQREFTDVQDEYNKEAEVGFVTEKTATKMRAARLKLEKAEKEEAWARAFTTQMQRGIDVWVQMEKAAKKAGDIIGDLLEGMVTGLGQVDLGLGQILENWKKKFADFKLTLPDFSEQFIKMRQDVEYFLMGLRGEIFPVKPGEWKVPEAYLRGAAIRETLDTMREKGEGLAEALGKINEKLQEFTSKYLTNETVEKLGEIAGKWGLWAIVAAPLVSTLFNVTEKLLILKVLLGIGKGTGAVGAAAGTGLVASLGWVAVGLLLIAGGALWLASILTNTTIPQQLELIRGYWTEKFPKALDDFKIKVEGAWKALGDGINDAKGYLNEFLDILKTEGPWAAFKKFIDDARSALDKLVEAMGKISGRAGVAAPPAAPTPAPPVAPTPAPIIPPIPAPYVPPQPACFVAGTLVATEGGPRAIETIKPSEFVHTTLGLQKVLMTVQSRRGNLVSLDIAGEEVVCSAEHRFHVKGAGWVEAINLMPDHVLTSRSKDVVLVRGPNLLPDRREAVYNLTVEGTHNYFVGNAQVLVHNIKAMHFGGLVPETNWYKLLEDEYVLTRQQWSALSSIRPDLPRGDWGTAPASQGPLVNIENAYIREEEDIDKLAAKISWHIGRKADKRARLGG